jgi:aminocarboxymuconate-semialdehyde decarboxylase
MSAASSDPTGVPIEDVHIHYVPAWWYTDVDGAAASVHPDISNLELIAEGARDGAGSRRVLGVSVEILYGTNPARRDDLRRLNQALAQDAAKHADAFLAIATIDAFSGDDAAEDVREAVTEFGHAGIIVDSARGGVVLGEPSTLPALRAAAELGVPVFVHPVWTDDLEHVEATSGRSAAAWGRGYRNGHALLQLLHDDVLRSIPNLRVIFTALGVGVLFFAYEQLAALRGEDGERPQVFFDTTALHPASIRYALDVVGPERLLIGTDFPFHDDDRDAILSAVGQLDLSQDELEAVLNGNFRSLFRAAVSA